MTTTAGGHVLEREAASSGARLLSHKGLMATCSPAGLWLRARPRNSVVGRRRGHDEAPAVVVESLALRTRPCVAAGRIRAARPRARCSRARTAGAPRPWSGWWPRRRLSPSLRGPGPRRARWRAGRARHVPGTRSARGRPACGPAGCPPRLQVVRGAADSRRLLVSSWRALGELVALPAAQSAERAAGG